MPAHYKGYWRDICSVFSKDCGPCPRELEDGDQGQLVL